MSNDDKNQIYSYPTIAVETKRDRCVCRSCANERCIPRDMIHEEYTRDTIYEHASCWYCEKNIIPTRLPAWHFQ